MSTTEIVLVVLAAVAYLFGVGIMGTIGYDSGDRYNRADRAFFWGIFWPVALVLLAGMKMVRWFQ